MEEYKMICGGKTGLPQISNVSWHILSNKPQDSSFKIIVYLQID